MTPNEFFQIPSSQRAEIMSSLTIEQQQAIQDEADRRAIRAIRIALDQSSGIIAVADSATPLNSNTEFTRTKTEILDTAQRIRNVIDLCLDKTNPPIILDPSMYVVDP